MFSFDLCCWLQKHFLHRRAFLTLLKSTQNSGRWSEEARMTKDYIKEEIKTKKVAQTLRTNPMLWVWGTCELEGYVTTLAGAVVRPVYLLSLEIRNRAKSHSPVEESVVSEFQEGPNQDTCVPERPSCTCGLASFAGHHLLSTWSASFFAEDGFEEWDSLKRKFTAQLWHP